MDSQGFRNSVKTKHRLYNYVFSNKKTVFNETNYKRKKLTNASYLK